MRGCDCVWQDEEVPSRFDGMRGCDRVSGRGKCAIAFEEDEGMRSHFGEREECDRFLGNFNLSAITKDFNLGHRMHSQKLHPMLGLG